MTAAHARRCRPAWRFLLSGGWVIGLLGLLLLAALVPVPSAHADPAGKPTVVLVHGAWADPSGWNGVAERLRNEGYPVVTTTNPMRSLSGDAEYVAGVLAGIDGPIILVGHSYGGAIITNTAAGNPNVKALVYIAAFAPDQGESALGLILSVPGSGVPLALIVKPYINDGIGIDTYLNPLLFHQVFCADVSTETAAAMAAAQRPTTLAAGLEPTAKVAWKTIPSWYLVAQNDKTIPPEAQRSMARRAGAHTVEIPSAHAAMVSNPGPVTDLIRTAANAVG
jgi:pimeloyl-ACP methyl ester carboxylesterase